MNSVREGLTRTLCCYLHQDWTMEFASEGEALGMIVRECAPEDVAAAASEIDGLILPATEEQLATALMDVGCYYYPPGDGNTYRNWLVHVRDLFASDRRGHPLRTVAIGAKRSEWASE
jgi:hypothetical protein